MVGGGTLQRQGDENEEIPHSARVSIASLCLCCPPSHSRSLSLLHIHFNTFRTATAAIRRRRATTGNHSQSKVKKEVEEEEDLNNFSLSHSQLYCREGRGAYSVEIHIRLFSVFKNVTKVVDAAVVATADAVPVRDNMTTMTQLFYLIFFFCCCCCCRS